MPSCSLLKKAGRHFHLGSHFDNSMKKKKGGIAKPMPPCKTIKLLFFGRSGYVITALSFRNRLRMQQYRLIYKIVPHNIIVIISPEQKFNLLDLGNIIFFKRGIGPRHGTESTLSCND